MYTVIPLFMRERKCIYTCKCIKKLKKQTPIIPRRLEYRGTSTFSLIHFICQIIFYKYYFKYWKNREKLNLCLNILCIHIHNWTTNNKKIFWNIRGLANFQINEDGKLFPYLVCEMIMLPSVLLVCLFFGSF